MRRVITYGTFDLFHDGHKRLLERAKKLGEYLIVGVTSDDYDVERGKLNVAQRLETRIKNVRESGLADEIIIEEREGQKVRDIQKYHIEIFAIGSDWVGKFDYLNRFCKVVYLERTPGVSSTLKRNMENGVIRLGILGPGRIADRFVLESRFVTNSELVAVCGRDIDKTLQFAKKHKIPISTISFSEFFESIDAVYIATPHDSHPELVRMCLNSNKHVLVEKPMSLSFSEANNLFEIASRKNLVLMEAVKTAYSPGFMRLLDIALSGGIGEIKSVDANFTMLKPRTGREWDPEKSGGSFFELATYPLLACSKIFGYHFVDVNFFKLLDSSTKVDEFTKFIITYEQAVFCGTVGIGVKTEGSLTISGTEGYIYVPAPWWKTDEFQIRGADGEVVKRYYYEWAGEGIRYEVACFVKAILSPSRDNLPLTVSDSLFFAKVFDQFVGDNSAGFVKNRVKP